MGVLGALMGVATFGVGANEDERDMFSLCRVLIGNLVL